MAADTTAVVIMEDIWNITENPTMDMVDIMEKVTMVVVTMVVVTMEWTVEIVDMEVAEVTASDAITSLELLSLLSSL